MNAVLIIIGIICAIGGIVAAVSGRFSTKAVACIILAGLAVFVFGLSFKIVPT